VNSPWRSWSEAASPELLELFQGRQLECLREVRKRHPARCVPGTSDYSDLRQESVDALDQLACDIQEEFGEDAEY